MDSTIPLSAGKGKGAFGLIDNVDADLFVDMVGNGKDGGNVIVEPTKKPNIF